MSEDAAVKVTVRCFASVRELLGREELEVDLPEGATVSDLRARLARDAPDLTRLPLAFAVNCDYAAPERVLREGDEVALVPPISGGAEQAVCRFEFRHGPLDPRPLEEEARTDADGAIVTFAGVTRDHNDGTAVEGLSYEAYEEMAAKVMGRLFEEIVQRFEITRVRVAHRLGEVPVGEASILVVVSAPHRDAAFAACRTLMDRIKAEVPIFKKERLARGGGTRWIGEPPAPAGG